ncbi:hypothetical protein [Leifsonia poae]|uniref:hypothetical protein n=1 Tax=Leifsonia poae TaxID=110933 RepID=UPI003D67802F
MTSTPEGAGTPAESQAPAASAAAQAAPENSGATTDPAVAENSGVEETDRPGDIPFDQAAAEHENPALE